MADQWMIRGVEYANCNCAYGCPCQFNAPTTNGFCEAVVCGKIEEGYFNDTRLDGIDWAMLVHFPGEIAEGNGQQQVIIHEGADPAQREALRKILHGESTTPGTNIFAVVSSLMAEVFETLSAPIELDIDVDTRKARLRIPGVVESTGTPIVDPFSGGEFQARINLPNGIEYTVAEVGSGRTKSSGKIPLDLDGSYGQFSILHWNQDGVIR